MDVALPPVRQRRIVMAAMALATAVVIVLTASPGIASASTTYTMQGEVLLEGTGNLTDIVALIYVSGTTVPVQTDRVQTQPANTAGLWVAAGLPTGEYTVVLHYTGTAYFTDTSPPGSPNSCVIAGCTADLHQNTFVDTAVMEQAEEVQGTVTDQIAGTPLPGMLVDVYEYSGPQESPVGPHFQTTDANGHYDLHGLNAAHVYYVSVSDPSHRYASAGYQGQIFNYGAQGSALPHLLFVTADIPLERGSTVSGTVTIPGALQADVDAGLVTAKVQYDYYYVGGDFHSYVDSGLGETLFLVNGTASYSIPALPISHYQMLFTYAGKTLAGSATDPFVVTTQSSSFVENATVTLGPTPPVAGSQVIYHTLPAPMTYPLLGTKPASSPASSWPSPATATATVSTPDVTQLHLTSQRDMRVSRN